MTEKIVPGE